MVPEVTAELLARYHKEEAAVTRRILRRLAAEYPLTYLAWLAYARRGHKPCDRPGCPMCHPIRELTIPLPEELVA